MTIKNIANAINADPELYITIWDCYRDNLLYCGRYDRLTERMCNWVVENFGVVELEVKDYGTRVTKMVFILEYQAETK